MTQNVKQISLIGLFSAFAVAMGYVFIYIPNVELITAVVFIAGFLLGPKSGLFVGLLAEGIYSLLNPFGAPTPPLFAAQLISFGFNGFLGGILGKKIDFSQKWHYLLSGFAGFSLTVIYAVLTTLSFILFARTGTEGFISSILTGIGYYIAHLVSNFLIFTLLVPLLINKARKSTYL